MDLYDEKETILYQARVGRRIGLLYVLVSVFCFFIAALFLILSIFAFKQGTNPFSGFAAEAIFLAVGIIVLMMRRTMLRREYILTDRRLIIRKGGAISKSTRFLDLSDIRGVELSNNFIIDLFGVCSLDFYSPSISSASKKFLIFSISTTPFKFQYINKEDGESLYRIMSERKR